MPDNIFCNSLYRKMNLAHGKIKRQEKQQTASWVIRAILSIGIQHTFSQEGPLSGSDDHRPLLAGSSQGGVQVGRRKPVTQGDPAREILAGSPTAGDGRLGEVTNGRFVEFQFAETGFG